MGEIKKAHYCSDFSFDKREKNCKKTAKIIIPPPNNTKNGGFSFANSQAHSGPKTASVNIIIPTIADGVFLAPIVIKIKPKPIWKKPAKKPKNIS